MSLAASGKRNLRSLETSLEALVERAVSRSGIPGISLALSVCGERFTAVAGVGDTVNGAVLSQQGRFQLGCLTKLLTALLALRLAHSGTLDLDAPIETYLPEYAGTTFARITARHLASHASGYEGLNLGDPGVAYYYSDEKLHAFARGTPQTFSPGTVFNYEHSESVLLGHIIRRITGRAVVELMQEWLFAPLGISCGTVAATQDPPSSRVAEHSLDGASRTYKPLRKVPYSRFWATSLSDLTISPRELLELGELLVGTRICPDWPARSLNELHEPLVRVPDTAGGPARERMPVAFGFGCAHYGGGIFGHNGSARGQTVGFRFEPQSRTTVAVAINTWNPHLRDVLLNRVFELVRPARSLDACAEPVAVLHLSELEGVYAGGTQGVRIEAQRTGEALSCVVRNRYIPGEIRVQMAQDQAGRLAPQSDIGHLSVGFFREPTAGCPCVMLGLNAYRKSA